ncbi:MULTISPECIES: putative phage abortive infection protein [unclassified Pseudomonas]|uniref:putative phage abortive infection protein n=1 Tax=unclassified Pseudomonas TaxID=196821 RepID=UPI00244920BB|nr:MULTISPECIES: putative phage abortive infection protein [unclassified Pseudomonas]MDG9930341.1 putative phage abortive infection protein [Pseudomonas sp. GD04042]MDH0484546.1 putative phage abortive infection protein [Pseudomonas sp. GD04015]MDH0605996.1 putative phage abortive infection protein [Pseudomonas sp. GD03869]
MAGNWDDSSGENAAEPKDGRNIDQLISVILAFALTLFGIVALLVGAHFFIGYDIPLIETKHVGSAAHWGQIGDFVGGVLNPSLSFLALIAVLVSLRGQAQEVQAARAEARSAIDIQNKQTEIFNKQSLLIEKQNFESSLYGLLEMKTRVLEALVKTRKGPVEPIYGLPVITREVAARHADCLNYVDDDSSYDQFVQNCKAFSFSVEDSAGHYFHLLSSIFHHVSDYCNDSRLMIDDLVVAFLPSYMRSDKKARDFYVNIVLSSLSATEVEGLFIYMVGNEDKKLKRLAKSLDIFKRLPHRVAYDKYNLKEKCLA